MEKTKKPTNAQLTRKINEALVFVPRDKETKEIYFDDKGLRIQVTDDYCVIGTNFHRHVFQAITSSGFSSPYIYVKRFLEIALDVDCIVTDENGNPTGHSYALLFQKLADDKERDNERNIAIYTDWWLSNIFHPLYSIDANAASEYMTYFDYLHSIAVNSIILGERKEDMTNADFTKLYLKAIKDLTDGIEPYVILEKNEEADADEKEIKAMAEDDKEQSLANYNA